MKKIIAFTAVMAVFLCLFINVYADDVMKISMNDEVKRAKEIGTGNGITFTLPDVDNKFLIDAIELAIFEKQASDTNYKILGESKTIENPSSLNISFGFGNITKYKEKAKYKIAYRYYAKPIDDLSKTIIAGEDIKDGWRLVGEITPDVSTDSGLIFIKMLLQLLQLRVLLFRLKQYRE
jgi:hypothetical protein